jgi:hypothetical protein
MINYLEGFVFHEQGFPIMSVCRRICEYVTHHIKTGLFRPCLFYLLDYGIAALQKPKIEEKNKRYALSFFTCVFFPPPDSDLCRQQIK